MALCVRGARLRARGVVEAGADPMREPKLLELFADSIETRAAWAWVSWWRRSLDWSGNALLQGTHGNRFPLRDELELTGAGEAAGEAVMAEL